MEKSIERLMVMMEECFSIAKHLENRHLDKLKETDVFIIKESIHSIYHEAVVIKEILLLKDCPFANEVI